jgi:hypothetical protein
MRVATPAFRRWTAGWERIKIMGLFRRTRPSHAGPRVTRAERRAAERTAQAEASLEKTEEQIHELADEARRKQSD